MSPAQPNQRKLAAHLAYGGIITGEATNPGDQRMNVPVGEAIVSCATCGNDLRANAWFCDSCGSPVVERAAGERKQVTVLFADVVGSMKLAASLDPERLQEIMHELLNRAGAVVQRYHGTVDKFTGDGLMALFGAPVALEDHALRACFAALEIQSVAKTLSAELHRRDGIDMQLRVGLNSGEVITGEIGLGPNPYTAVGHPVGMAQRMEAAAPAGGVLCSLSTAQLVEQAARLGPLVAVAVKNEPKPVPARELHAVDSGRTIAVRDYGPMLGRRPAMSALARTFDDARGSVVGVVGSPGLGKSRLIREFSGWAASKDVDVVVARCEAHTAGVPFRALSRMLRAMFRIDQLGGDAARRHVVDQLGNVAPDPDDTRILFDLLGIGDSSSAVGEVSVDAQRRRLVDMMINAVLARRTRTLIVLEDAHWIDATSDATVAEFAATFRATAAVLVVTYRPEYSGALQAILDTKVELQPLTDETTIELITGLVGRHPSVAGLVRRIADRAAGNPFFAEEIVRDLAGRDVLTGSRGDYKLNDALDEIAVPATVQSVLAARIDRLPPNAKSILNAAAVIGTRFDLDSVQALLTDAEPRHLADLVSAELIDQTEFVPRQRYCFRHPLVRTVAYESQLTATRAEAHKRLAAAIESRDPAAAPENAALIAAHLEQAGEAHAAYAWHMRAAEWLRFRDLPAARASWTKARQLADQLSDDAESVTSMRIAPRTMLASTAHLVGGEEDTDERYRELRELTTRAGDLLSLALGTAGQVISLSTNHNRLADAAQLASELAAMVDHIDCPEPTKLEILHSVTWAHFLACDFPSALRAIDRQKGLAGEDAAISKAQTLSVRAAIEIYTGDHESGRRHFRQAIEQARALHPVTYAQVLTGRSWFVAMGLDDARELVAQTREALLRTRAFGDNFGVVSALWAHGTVLLRADPAARAEAIGLLEEARAGIERHGIQTFLLCSVLADLAVEAARKGAHDDAILTARRGYRSQLDAGSPTMVCRTAETLIELLVGRGSSADAAEARSVAAAVTDMRLPSEVPALDLCRLKCLLMVSRSEGEGSGYADLARQYLALVERLDACGRLAEARQMVADAI
jgi:adenylate cyclase